MPNHKYVDMTMHQQVHKNKNLWQIHFETIEFCTRKEKETDKFVDDLFDVDEENLLTARLSLGPESPDFSMIFEKDLSMRH